MMRRTESAMRLLMRMQATREKRDANNQRSQHRRHEMRDRIGPSLRERGKRRVVPNGTMVSEGRSGLNPMTLPVAQDPTGQTPPFATKQDAPDTGEEPDKVPCVPDQLR